MWAECTCRHHRSDHFWDRTVDTFCECCAVCGRKRRDHSPYEHDFQRCSCNLYKESA